MLRMMGWILGVLGIVLTQQTAMAARTCSREEIREMIFAGSSMRQVEQECSNAREAFSRPLPNRPVQMPPPPVPGTAPAPPAVAVEAPPEPASVASEEPPPAAVEEAPEEPETQATAAAPEPPASEAPAVPDPLSDPDIVAMATPATLATSDWRSRLPQVDEEPAGGLTPIPAPEPATEQVSTTGQTPAPDTDLAPAPLSETPSPASSPVAAATPSAASTSPSPASPPAEVADPPPAPPSAAVAALPPPARPEPAASPSPPTVAETAPPESPRMLSTATPEPAPTTQQRRFVPRDGEVPAADLTAVAVARPEQAAFVPPGTGTALTVAANSCPQTSLWWSGGPSRSVEYIDICSIQLELGELDRYYRLIPFTGLNAATERRFDEDRNGISDKGTRVGNTVYWGGRDCADGVVRIRRDQCDAADKSGCAVVSLHLQAKPGQPPTTLTLQPTFYLLYPNGSRLPSEGKAQSLGYQGCGG